MDTENKYINSIFEQPWWLDAVAPGMWDCAVIENGGEVIARLPYVYKRRLGFKLIGMPPYTQTLGIWIKDTGAKTARSLERQKDIIFQLIDKLPKNVNVDLSLDHSCNYVLPFLWKGFSIYPNFSYRIENLSNIEDLWANLRENIKREIKKANRSLEILDNLAFDKIITMQEKTFARQERIYNHKNDELLERLDKILFEHNARRLLFAIDEKQRIHAGAYFVFDNKTCYYLIGGSDPELRNSGAGSLLLWEGIKFASKVSRAFDFEGSMIEDIERFFRSFGGTPTPYYRVTRLNLALSFADYMKPKIKKTIGYK